MKTKIIIIPAMILSFAFTLSGCSSDTYKIKEVGGYDCGIVSTHESEFSSDFLSFTSYDNLFAPKEKSAIFFGYEITGQYQDSIKIDLYGIENTDRYTYNFSEGCVDFSIGQKTGKCLSYSCGFKNSEYLDRVTGPQISESECREIAADFLTEQLENFDQYEYEEVVTHNISVMGGDVHTFFFTKKMENMWTYERTYVQVTSYGDIIGYDLTLSGNIDLDTLPSKYDSVKMDHTVSQRLEQMYESVQEQYREITHSVESERLIRLKNGKYVILYDIETALTDSDGRTLYDPSMFVVYLD